MRLLAIIIKEFLHIIRDKRTLFLAIMMPLAMIFLYGYAINLDVRNITLAVVDQDKSSDSRELADKFSKSGYFRIDYFLDTFETAEELFRSGKVKGILTIPQNFSKSFSRDFSVPLQIVVDGSDGNTAQTAMAYSRAIIAEYNTEHLPNGMKVPLEITPRYWYNPALKSAYFVVPGLAAIILMMISALMTSISIAREKETGTMEQVLVTPIRVVENIFGKVIPYIFLALIDGLLVIGAGILMFGVHIEGSVMVLFLNTLVYLYAALSLGLLISTIASTEQTAMMVALMATLLPSIMLSGFIFPISSMPLPLQIISKILPATYYLKIIRGVVLKGEGMLDLIKNTAALFTIGTFLLIMAIRKYKVKLG